DIELDEKCSAAWLLIDGEKNIYEIAVEMAELCGDSKEVAIERLVPFIRYILKKNWIKFQSIKPQ
ncbi:MAG: PqqD family peptide modification chaperone, partial [Clostridium sp.]